MNKLKLQQLLDIISEMVNSPSGTWRETRDLILAECTESEKTNLFEFVAWFEESANE